MPLKTKSFDEQVILVHALSPDSISNIFVSKQKFEDIDFDNPIQTCVNAITKFDFLITPDGTMGTHLDFTKQQYEDNFIDRPHLSWSWNKLCFPNSRGNWEDSPIAILEPLSKVNNIIGCNPEDTLSMGTHRLSNQSIILVPEGYEEPIKKTLNNERGFNGVIKTYPKQSSLREAIDREIQTSFPGSLKLTNEAGDPISTLLIDADNAMKHSYIFAEGKFLELFVGNLMDTSTTLLIDIIDYKIEYEPYREYAKKRYLEGHHGFHTDIERASSTIKGLAQASTKIDSIENYSIHLLSNRKENIEIEKLFIYQSYLTYRNLSLYIAGKSYGAYLFKKAVMAELSYLMQSNSLLISKTDFNQRVDETTTLLLATLDNMEGLNQIKDNKIIGDEKSFDCLACQKILHEQSHKIEVHSDNLKDMQPLSDLEFYIKNRNSYKKEYYTPRALLTFFGFDQLTYSKTTKINAAIKINNYLARKDSENITFTEKEILALGEGALGKTIIGLNVSLNSLPKSTNEPLQFCR